MSHDFDDFVRNNIEARAFDLFRRGKPLPLQIMIVLLAKSLFIDMPVFAIRFLPGAIGHQLRQWHAKLVLNKLGRNCIVDLGVALEGAGNIDIADFVWVDRNVRLSARIGRISIGRRVHIAPWTEIAAGGDITIGDYVGISSGVMIYGHSEAPRDGKRMSGPMIPEEYKGMKTAPVVIEKDAFIGTNAVILPGVTVGEGAVVGACSLVTKDIPPYAIAIGVPAKPVGKRAKVTVPEM